MTIDHNSCSDYHERPPGSKKHHPRPGCVSSPSQEYLQVPAKKPCCSPVQSISRTLRKNTRTDHSFSRLTSRNIQSTLQNTQVLLYRASKNMKKHEQKRTFSDTPLSPPGSKKHLPGIAKGTAKILCCPPVQSI